MSRRMLPLLVALLLLPATARAGVDLGISAGTGISFTGQSGVDAVERLPVDLEVSGGPTFGPLAVEIGLKTVLEENRGLHFSERAFLLRPGIRVDVKVIYLRGAVPLRLATGDDFSWGLLAGAGWNIVPLGPLKLFLEGNARFTRKEQGSGFNFGAIETRLGLRASF